jgi:hypothetical protein
MAHFAKLDSNNKVLGIHVLHNNVITESGEENEQKGIDFLNNLHGHSYWKQMSYNTYGNVHHLGKEPFRKNRAEVNGYYDTTHDAFIFPPPIDYTGNTMHSWNANTSGNFLRVSPISEPTIQDHPEENHNYFYQWNESNYNSSNVNSAWVLFEIDLTDNSITQLT